MDDFILNNSYDAYDEDFEEYMQLLSSEQDDNDLKE
jgi:hypothetical protein